MKREPSRITIGPFSRIFHLLEILSMVIIFLSAIAGNSSAQQSAGQVMENTMCPVMTQEPIDPEIFVEYEGKRVYLCCMRCRRMFLENPHAYLANLPQFQTAESPIPDITDKNSEAITETPVIATTMTTDKQLRGVMKLIRFAGKFHPVVVHFPIALVLAAALAELLQLIFRRELFAHAARFSILLGAFGAVFAVLLGWATGAFAQYPGMENILSLHRWLGTSAGILIVFSAIFSEYFIRTSSPVHGKLYRVFLFSGALLVGLSGHFGAALIYGLDHFSW